MEIPVFVEPLAVGFRASTQCPLPLSAEGASADEAVAALQAVLHQRVQSGGQVRTLFLETDHRNGNFPAIAPLTPQKVEQILEAAQRLAADPLYDDWVRAVEEYRRENNTVPDPDR
jgi:hypothetical protein